MGRGIARAAAALAFAALILAANKGVADEPIVVLARDKAFCARLARETDRLEFVAPILKMPKIERYFDTRKHEYQDYYIDTNRLYFIDRTLANPKADLDRILKQKDWRKRLFNPGSPVPPTNRRLGYKLVYDGSGKWRALDRLAPDFLLRKWKSEDEPVANQAPDWYAIYAVDLNGDGVREHVLHRRFEGQGGNKVPSDYQYLDIIDIKTGKRMRIVEDRNLYGGNDLLKFVRYRGRVYLTGKTAFAIWFGATIGNSKRRNRIGSNCIFYKIKSFYEIGQRKLTIRKQRD